MHATLSYANSDLNVYTIPHFVSVPAQAKFEDVPWGSMTPEAQKAAKTLGWDKDSWNAQEW